MFERRPRVLGRPLLASYPGPIRRLVYWYDRLTDRQRVQYALASILFLIAFTSLSVIFFFAKDRRGENAWSWLIAPILATAALGVVIYYALINFYGLLGVDPHSNLRWEFPISYGVVAVIGIVWALILRVSRPRDYQAIGQGQRAVATEVQTADPYPYERIR